MHIFMEIEKIQMKLIEGEREREREIVREKHRQKQRKREIVVNYYGIQQNKYL